MPLTKLVMAPTTVPKILLVDDHPEVMRQVAQLLSAQFSVVGALPDGGGLQSAVGKHQPDLIVLDISLPGTSGIDLARELGGSHPKLKIVFLTVHADLDYAAEALAVGACGYVVKARLASDLIPALHAAVDGTRFISPCPELEALRLQLEGQ